MGSKFRLLQTLVAGSGVNSVPTQGLKWRGMRDRALPRVGFAGGLRCSEITGLDSHETEDCHGWTGILTRAHWCSLRGPTG